MQLIDAREDRTYQHEGITYLVNNRRAYLGDDPGLGKTIQAIVASECICSERTLVLCPALARIHWLNQFEIWSIFAPSSLVVQSRNATLTSANLTICSYDLAIQNSISTWLTSQPWDCVILDEAHYLNSRDTKRTKLIYKTLGHRAKYTWALSGSPIKKHMGELWPWLSFTGIYRGTYWEFVNEFLETKKTVYSIEILGTKPERLQASRALLAKAMLRRRGTVNLPAFTSYDVVVEPAKVDMRRWFPDVMIGYTKPEDLERQIADELRATESVMELLGNSEDAAKALPGLQKKTEKSRRYVGLQKAPVVAKIISDELQNNEYKKIVIFAWHRDVIECLRIELKEWHASVLYGGVLVTKRETLRREFERDPRVRVMICNITAAGIVIDLTAASEIAFVEPSYVPTENAQAIMRVHRFPQKQPVRCRFFSLYKHVDLQIQKILRRRAADIVSQFDTDSPSPGAAITPPPVINPFE